MYKLSSSHTHQRRYAHAHVRAQKSFTACYLLYSFQVSQKTSNDIKPVPNNITVARIKGHIRSFRSNSHRNYLGINPSHTHTYICILCVKKCHIGKFYYRLISTACIVSSVFLLLNERKAKQYVSKIPWNLRG